MPDLYGQLTPQGVLNGSVQTIVYADNYNDLTNKPSINSVELQGNKTAADLGLLTAGDIPVDSVNGKQGVVILDGDDIEYEAGTSVNSKITDLEAEIVSGPVTSVNGETGAVVLDGTEINYQAGKTINQKIDEVEAEIPVVSYPVTSVNGETGAVVLDGTDIEYSSGVSVNSQIDTLMNYIPVYGNTASGAIATFDTSLALPLQDLQIAINAVQESGTPTPSSPKAISGFTGANIHVADDENPHVIDNITAITWQSEAGTVYVGSLDVTSGKLTVTWVGIAINSVTWYYSSSNAFFYCPNANLPNSRKVAGGIICECYTVYPTPISSTSQIPSLPDKQIYCNTSNGNIIIKDTDYTNETAFANAVGNNMIIYEVETPVTYQLTPTQISAIVGTNNIFTDTNGNTSVVFACSLKDYIDSQ